MKQKPKTLIALRFGETTAENLCLLTISQISFLCFEHFDEMPELMNVGIGQDYRQMNIINLLLSGRILAVLLLIIYLNLRVWIKK